MEQNISFKSGFKPVNYAEYGKITNTISKKFFVDFPWTVNESVKASNAKTSMVFDCSVLGITDGKDVLMLHLCPSVKENSDYNKIKNFILKKIKIDNPNLQAALFGSQYNWTDSANLNDFLLSLMKKWNIPCSIFNTSKEAFNVAYKSNIDEWYITSKNISKALEAENTNSEDVFKSEFYKVELSELDEFA
ncbi:MAG: hypothetical protein E7Z89_01260 [Cyanobacteria bacterium SIG28]|nr:hypothetical protein [Cyanobacteria bacterium SIG28]